MDPRDIALIIWTYVPPAIIIAGTIGNVLSLMVVTNRHCRQSSFTVILAALAVTDTVYLYVNVLVAWLKYAFAINLASFGNIWCKMNGFLSFLTSHASSWLVAALAAERMFFTYFPNKMKTVLMPRTGYIVVGTIIGVLFLMNAHLLYAVQEIDVVNNSTLGTTCGIVVPGYETVYANVFAWIDLVLYFLLPIFVIVIANSATVVEVLRSNALTAALSVVNNNRMKTIRHLLIITLLVSSAFAIFLSPVTIFAVVVPHFYENDPFFFMNEGNTGYIIWTSLYIWSFLNHAVNFYLYILSGERFRRELKMLYVCKSSAENSDD